MTEHNFWKWLAKPYRLVTIALSVVMATIFAFNAIFSGGALDTTLPGEILAWAAFASFVLMSIGLGAINQRLVNGGLVLASGVLVGRLVFLGLTGGGGTPEFWFNFAWALTAIGAYLMESTGVSLHSTDHTEARHARHA